MLFVLTRSCATLLYLMTYLGVELVKNVFQVITLDRLLRVEKVKEFLHKLGSYVDFEALDFD